MVTRALDDVAESFGSFARVAVETLGRMASFTIRSVAVRPHFPSLVDQMMWLGVGSLPLVLFLSSFVGFISVLFVHGLAGGIGMQYIGAAVFRAVMADMGPTFTALVLAARMGSKMAGELGSMRITEQIDAMICLNLDPMRYLTGPRIMASCSMTPVVFILSSSAAIVGAQLLAAAMWGITPHVFYSGMQKMYNDDLVIMGLIKSLVFGTTIGICGTYYGYHARGGAIGVGDSIRAAVVTSSILILLGNVVITEFFVT
jgi:phospholipid/cholesterol/gamma-HCH transport system permease protein